MSYLFVKMSGDSSVWKVSVACKPSLFLDSFSDYSHIKVIDLFKYSKCFTLEINRSIDCSRHSAMSQNHFVYISTCWCCWISSLETFPLQANPDRYILKRKPEFRDWLKMLRQNGKFLYVITGSHVDFASHVASYAIGEDWLDLFDIVVFFARKPSFFIDRLGLCGWKRDQRWVLKNDFSRHSDLRRCENWFLGLTSALETGFHAGVCWNADWNDL